MTHNQPQQQYAIGMVGFGAHTYERMDAKGTFHTEWEKEKES